MTEKKLSTPGIFKALAWIWLLSFLLLMLSIGLVYVFNKHLAVTVSFGSVLFYTCLALLLLMFPVFSKIRISHVLSKKTLMAAVLDIPVLSKQEWRLFFVWHSLVITFLLVLFVFCRPYLFMLRDFFGNGRGNPAVFIFIVIMLALQFIGCLIHNKIISGEWLDENHPPEVMSRRFDVAGSIMLASVATLLIAWFALFMIRSRLGL